MTGEWRWGPGLDEERVSVCRAVLGSPLNGFKGVKSCLWEMVESQDLNFSHLLAVSALHLVHGQQGGGGGSQGETRQSRERVGLGGGFTKAVSLR